MEYKIIYSDELCHHGVKGMKWGVRKDERVASAESRYRGAKSDAKQARRDASSFARRHMITSRIKGTKNYDKANELRGNAKNKADEVTRAKERLQSTTKLVKTDRYRNAMVSNAEYNAARSKESAKRAQKNIDDLKTNGEQASVYQRKMKRDLERKKRNYENEHGEGSYTTAHAWADSFAYSTHSKQRISDMIKNETSKRNSHISDAQKYIKTKKALMEMPITEITTKNDVRKVYNKQYNGD